MSLSPLPPASLRDCSDFYQTFRKFSRKNVHVQSNDWFSRIAAHFDVNSVANDVISTREEAGQLSSRGLGRGFRVSGVLSVENKSSVNLKRIVAEEAGKLNPS